MLEIKRLRYDGSLVTSLPLMEIDDTEKVEIHDSTSSSAGKRLLVMSKVVKDKHSVIRVCKQVSIE